MRVTPIDNDDLIREQLPNILEDFDIELRLAGGDPDNTVVEGEEDPMTMEKRKITEDDINVLFIVPDKELLKRESSQDILDWG